MKESFFSKAKADGAVFVKTVNVVTKLSKLKIDMLAKQQEKGRILSAIGKSVFDAFHENQNADPRVVFDGIREQLDQAERADHEIAELQERMVKTKADFRSNSSAPESATEDDDEDDD